MRGLQTSVMPLTAKRSWESLEFVRDLQRCPFPSKVLKAYDVVPLAHLVHDLFNATHGEGSEERGGCMAHQPS